MSSPCRVIPALLFMELWAGAEPAVLSPVRRTGHASPSANRATAAGPPGLSREPPEEEARRWSRSGSRGRCGQRGTQYYGCVLLCTQQPGDHE